MCYKGKKVVVISLSFEVLHHKEKKCRTFWHVVILIFIKLSVWYCKDFCFKFLQLKGVFLHRYPIAWLPGSAHQDLGEQNNVKESIWFWCREKN